MKISILLFGLLFASAHAQAADDRLETLQYNPDAIVRIVGRIGIQSTIQFGPDERIENIAVGDSASWQVTPNRRGSVIFLKPTDLPKRTNMTVVTDHRTYLFDLIPGSKDSTPLYSLRFSYPPDQTTTPVEMKAPLAKPTAPRTESALAQLLYFDWRAKGAKELLPLRSFDDGKSLFVEWSQRTPLPAVSFAGQNGEHGPVNYRVAGKYIVISPVPNRITLRYGKDAADLWRSEPLPPTPVENTPEGRVGAEAAVAAADPPPAAAVPAQPQVSRPQNRADLVAANTADLINDDLAGGRR